MSQFALRVCVTRDACRSAARCSWARALTFALYKRLIGAYGGKAAASEILIDEIRACGGKAAAPEHFVDEIGSHLPRPSTLGRRGAGEVDIFRRCLDNMIKRWTLFSRRDGPHVRPSTRWAGREHRQDHIIIVFQVEYQRKLIQKHDELFLKQRAEHLDSVPENAQMDVDSAETQFSSEKDHSVKPTENRL